MISRIYLVLCCCALLGCGRDTSPVEPAAAGVDPGTAALRQASLGQFRIHLDLASPSATVEPISPRAGAQSELYNLAINAFLSPETFRVTGIALSEETVELTYALRHPFRAASNLAGPPTAANREDLAITGRILWLADDPDPETYFAGDGEVRVNTRIVRNPDGYFTPGALIADPGTSATTFPYQLMVDEARDNRQALSNAGSATGNYGASGWQVAEFTAGITGFDVLAQGQTAVNTLEIARGELGGATTFAVTAALLAKYEDPRGGADPETKRANRLPSGDVLAFGYRLPHAALDCGVTRVLPVGAIQAGSAATLGIGAHVRDWDARAPEAGQTNLATESNPQLVSLGEAGMPTVTVSIPGLSGIGGTTLTLSDDDSDFGGDPGTDSGRGMDELFFSGTISGMTATEGTLRGLVRVRDIVDTTPPADWLTNRIDLGPGLVPLGTGQEGATYQSFSVDVLPGTAGAFDYADVWGGDAADIARAVALDAAGNSYVTGSYNTTVDFDPGPGMAERTTSAGTDAFIVSFDPAGGFRWVATIEGDLTSVGLAIAADAVGNTVVGGWFDSMIDLDPGAGADLRTSNGGPDAFLLGLDPGGNHRWGVTWGSMTGNGERVEGVALDSANNCFAAGGFDGSADFDPGPGTATRNSNGGGGDAFITSFTDAGTWRWANAWGAGTGVDRNHAVALDAYDRPYVVGAFEGTVDFRQGAGVAERSSAGSWDSSLVALTNGGGFRWVSSWGGNPSDEAYCVAVSPGGQSYVGGYFGGATDFDPGAGIVTRSGKGFSDAYLLALDTYGDYRWVHVYSSNGHEQVTGVALDAVGRVFATGGYQGTIDFDAGAGVAERTSLGSYDSFVVSLRTDGAFRWAASWGGVDEVFPYGVAVTSLGRSHTVGSYWGTADFDPGAGMDPHTSNGNLDAYMVVLQP